MLPENDGELTIINRSSILLIECPTRALLKELDRDEQADMEAEAESGHLLVRNLPDTRPIAVWRIRCDLLNVPMSGFLDFIKRDQDIQAWLRLGMTYRMEHNDQTAVFETRDPAVAATIAADHGVVWHRAEYDAADPQEPEADGLFASGSWKLYLVFVAPFSEKLLDDAIFAITKKYGFEFQEEYCGPMPEKLRRPCRRQMWFTTFKQPKEADVEAMRQKLNELIGPTICEVSHFDPNDFCNLVLYPGHPGYRGNGAYIGRGLGFALISGDDDDDDDDGDGPDEPVPDPENRYGKVIRLPKTPAVV
jgi:hypothetical protein